MALPDVWVTHHHARTRHTRIWCQGCVCKGSCKWSVEMPGKEREFRWTPSSKGIEWVGSLPRPRKRAHQIVRHAQASQAVRFKKPTKIPAEDTCSNEEFDERRRNSDEESRAADPDNGNFFIDKVVCVKVDAAGNQWSTSRLPVSTIILSFDALTSPCTITIPPITTTTNDSQSVSQRTIEWTLAGPHTRG